MEKRKVIKLLNEIKRNFKWYKDRGIEDKVIEYSFLIDLIEAHLKLRTSHKEKS